MKVHKTTLKAVISGILALTTILAYQNCSIQAFESKSHTKLDSSISQKNALAPKLSFTIEPKTWRVGSGANVELNYSLENATTISGRHTFEGTCPMSERELPWTWPSSLTGDSRSILLNTVPGPKDRDDRGCTITYCIDAANEHGTSTACVPVEVVAVGPALNFKITPSVWRLGSGDQVEVSYFTQGALSTRGYHMFEGTCPSAALHAGKEVDWHFGNATEGNLWMDTLRTVPTPGERDDRGCDITYCIAATNSEGTNTACRSIKVE